VKHTPQSSVPYLANAAMLESIPLRHGVAGGHAMFLTDDSSIEKLAVRKTFPGLARTRGDGGLPLALYCSLDKDVTPETCFEIGGASPETAKTCVYRATMPGTL
jgi:hypothetical protein